MKRNTIEELRAGLTVREYGAQSMSYGKWVPLEEVEELLRDKARLNWLAFMGATIHKRLVNESWIYWLSVDGQGLGFDFYSARAAIDAAMQKEGE